MNPHFCRHDKTDIELPSCAFGYLDHFEVSDDRCRQTTLLAFDLIDAQWLLDQGQMNPLFNLADEEGIGKAWREWSQRFADNHSPDSPFEHAPLYRLEIDASWWKPWFRFFGTSSRFWPHTREGGWFEFSISRTRMGWDWQEANIYLGLFSDPIRVFVKGKMPNPRQGKALSAIFSLTHLPPITTEDFSNLLLSAAADNLAVFNVGQGNANALLASQGNVREPTPTMYYDLGAGVYRNRYTTPGGLAFCFTFNPVIVLSHWDADHWAGVYVTTVGGAYPALKRTWIAPLQDVGPIHIAFAHDVISNGGKFHIYSAPAGSVGGALLACGRQLLFTIGNGYDRNGTGIVIAIEDKSYRSWLLTGDCDYTYFVSALKPSPPVAIVAPHHGASLVPSSPVPAPIGASYKRLVYSFGANNRHGRTRIRHPTSLSVTAHKSAGWAHGTWVSAMPGCSVPGSDVLATCIHSPGGMLGGVLIGWNAPPPIFLAPCGGTCTTTPVQS